MAATTRRLKNRTPISSSVDTNTWEELRVLSEKTRINVSKLLDEAIQDLLKKYESYNPFPKNNDN
jgi:hypothetical protein